MNCRSSIRGSTKRILKNVLVLVLYVFPLMVFSLVFAVSVDAAMVDIAASTKERTKQRINSMMLGVEKINYLSR